MMVLIILGEMGSGKTFLGQAIASSEGIPYFEGDDFLPDVLREKVARANPLTVSDVDLFVIDSLVPGMVDLASKHSRFVISQALYREDHREFIQSELQKKGIDVEYYWIQAASILLQIKALWKRERGFKWILVMLLSKPWFQKPAGAKIIRNDYRATSLINRPSN